MSSTSLSLIEELEAVDWYAQRVDAAGDDALREVLVHNRDEEKEHACMTLEKRVRLYLEESFSAEVNAPEAAVPLVPPETRRKS